MITLTYKENKTNKSWLNIYWAGVFISFIFLSITSTFSIAQQEFDPSLIATENEFISKEDIPTIVENYSEILKIDNIESIAPISTPEFISDFNNKTDILQTNNKRILPVWVKQGDVINLIGNVIELIGNPAMVIADEGIITANKVILDPDANTVTARDNFSFDTKDQMIYHGSEGVFNINNNEWEFIGFNAVFPPGYLVEDMNGELIVKSDSMHGNNNQLFIENAYITTCDLEHPHYHFATKRADIKPGNRVIMHQNSIYIGDFRVLHLPWFWFDLHEKSSMPDIGYNDADGYYVTVPYQYIIDDTQHGNLFLTIATKSYLSGGGTYNLDTQTVHSSANVLINPLNDEYLLEVEHTHQLHKTLNFNANYSREINYRMYNNSDVVTINNFKGNLSYSGNATNSALNVVSRLQEGRFEIDDFSGTFTLNTSLSGSQDKVNSRLSINSNYTSYKNHDDPTIVNLWNRVTLNNNMNFDDKSKRLDLVVNYDDYEKLDDIDRTVSGVERKPEVYLTTNSKTAAFSAITDYLPTTIELRYGSYNELQTNEFIDRYRLQLNNNFKAFELGETGSKGNSEMRFSTSFWQTSYGDEDRTAMYEYNLRADFTTNILSDGLLTSRMSWTMQDGDGYSPLRMDTIYKAHSLSESLQYRGSKNNFTLTAGKDLERNIWHDITLFGTVRSGDNFLTTQRVGYDLNNKRWRDLVSRFEYHIPGKTIDSIEHKFANISLNTRYSIEADQFTQISTSTELNLTKKLNVKYVASYNPVTKKYSYNQYLLTYDMHCWTASLFANPTDKQYYFTLQIKAFNLSLPGFGVGAGGDAISNFNQNAQQ